jgi:hypothetical protein
MTIRPPDEPQVGDLVLFRPTNESERRDANFDTRGVVVGFEGTYVYISRERDSKSVPYFSTSYLTPSRVEGFQWEHGAQQYDLYENTVGLRQKLKWATIKW